MRILCNLVPRSINTTTFAARDFWPRRGASDEHTLQRSVRSEQRSLGQKEPPPGGLPSLFGSGFVAPRSQPHCGGCFLVAPRQNRKSTPQTWSYLWNGVLSFKTPTPVIRLHALRLAWRAGPLLGTNHSVPCPIWRLAVTVL